MDDSPILERQCPRARKKTLMLLDNCPAHSSFRWQCSGKKTFLRVLILLKNTTSKFQACDQGYIRSLKAHYLRRLGGLLVHKAAKYVSLYEGLMNLHAAWLIGVFETDVDEEMDLKPLAEIENNEITMEAAVYDPDTIVDRLPNKTVDEKIISETNILPAPSTTKSRKMIDQIKG